MWGCGMGEKSRSEPSLVLRGRVLRWGAGGSSRLYSRLELTVAVLNHFADVQPYEAATGSGEQRVPFPNHYKKLGKAMKEGEYTPTELHLHVDPKSKKQPKLVGDGEFELELVEEGQLRIIDGGHRQQALEWWLQNLAAHGEKGRVAHDELLDMPVPVILHLNGRLMNDFINLQQGKPIDASQLFTIKASGEGANDDERLAVGTAKVMSMRAEDGPFFQTIRFDTRHEPKDRPLGVKSLCSLGASDVSTSLLGLARVYIASHPDVDLHKLWSGNRHVAARGPDFECAMMIRHAHAAILKHAPDLIEEYGKLLNVFREKGKVVRGAASLMVGLGICLGFRVWSRGAKDPTGEELNALVAAASRTLDYTTKVGPDDRDEDRRGLGANEKRQHIGNFARAFFANWEGEKYQGVPLLLVRTLTPSAYGLQGKPPKLQTAPAPSEADNT